VVTQPVTPTRPCYSDEGPDTADKALAGTARQDQRGRPRPWTAPHELDRVGSEWLTSRGPTVLQSRQAPAATAPTLI